MLNFRTICILPTAYCLLVFSSSCKPKTDYSKEISRLDSALTKLKESEVVFTAIDTAALLSTYVSAQEKLTAISGKIAKDTLNKALTLFLSDAYMHTTSLHNLLENKKYFEKAVKDAQQRIDNLKHDLSEDLIEEKNKSLEYVVHEVNASAKIHEVVNRSVGMAKTSAAKLDSLRTKIIFLADSLAQ